MRQICYISEPIFCPLQCVFCCVRSHKSITHTNPACTYHIIPYRYMRNACCGEEKVVEQADPHAGGFIEAPLVGERGSEGAANGTVEV